MAATVLFSGELAPGASTPEESLALVAPFRGVEVSVAVDYPSVSGAVAHGMYVQYCTSIDGATYSDWETLAQLLPGNGSTQAAYTVLKDSFATDLKVKALNRENVACNVNISAVQFS